MSRRDPTLPDTSVTSLPEADLVARVKTEADSAALLSLVNRHSGLYFTVVNRYAAAYPNAVKARDLDDDKLFNLYTFICAYDPTRGMKLSTYIGDRTDYLCKTMLTKSGRNPVTPGAYATGSAVMDDALTTIDGSQVTLVDQSATARVTEVAERDLGLVEIARAAGEVCTDQRFTQILQYRHFAPNHQAMSWREIGERLHMTHEGARQVYERNLASVKAHLAEAV